MSEIDSDITGSQKAAQSGGQRMEENQVVAQAQRETEQAEKRRQRDGPRKITENETLVVDFMANFVAGGNDASYDLVRGRVLMSNRRLILVTADNRTVVPITSIFDIAVGQVPPEVEEFFDHTVMVGYVVGDQRRTAVVGGDRETIEKFSLLLYRAALNGSTALVKHPAEIGGRVMDSPMRTADLHLDPHTVVFPGNDQLGETEGPFEIDLATVVFFEVLERTIDDEKRLVLSVRHVVDGQTVTSEVSIPSRRKMNILGRYLRQMYFYIKTSVRDIELDEKEVEVLVGLYSSGPDIDLAPLLGVEQAELDHLLELLHEDGLIDEPSEPCDLTPQGRFLVNEEIEDVNA